MASRTITFRFPEEVIQAIEARARAIGSNRTAVLMEALTHAYGFPASSTPPVSTDALQNRLQGLEQQIIGLLQQLTESVQEVKSSSAVASEQGLLTEGEAVQMLASQSPLVTQLEHQARMLEQVLAATPDVVFVQDREGRFTYVNPAGARALGIGQNHFLGMTCQDFNFSEELIRSFSANRKIVFATGRSVSGEATIATDYETRDFEYSLNPVLGPNGSVETVVCTARDVTERKQAETDLRESEQKYRHLFELANDSIFIIDANTDRILNVNRNAARRLGYTRRELIQLYFSDIEAYPATNSSESILMEIQRVGSVIYEHVLRHKDGTEIPVEISSRLIEYDDILVIQNFVRDITERKKVEARLRLLESAILSADDAIVITEATPVDEPGPRIIHVNESFMRMTGYRLEEVIGKTPRILQGPKTDRAQLDQIRQAMANSQPVRVEVINYRKDGSELWMELTMAPIANSDGQYTHWIAVQRDITARKQATEGTGNEG